MWRRPGGRLEAAALQAGNPDDGHLFFSYGAATRKFSFAGVYGACVGAVWRAPVFAAEQDRHDGGAIFHRAVDLSGLGVAQLLFNVVLAYLLRGDRPAFYMAAAGCALMAATLAVFFAFTYPANVATQNWTVSPGHWVELRRQWEYSHAVNAGLYFLAFCFVAGATVASRR